MRTFVYGNPYDRALPPEEPVVPGEIFTNKGHVDLTSSRVSVGSRMC